MIDGEEIAFRMFEKVKTAVAPFSDSGTNFPDLRVYLDSQNTLVQFQLFHLVICR